MGGNNLFKEFLDLGFGFCFFFCGGLGKVGCGSEAGVGVKEGVCLMHVSFPIVGGFGMGFVTWASRDRVCCRSCAHPLPVEIDMAGWLDYGGI